MFDLNKIADQLSGLTVMQVADLVKTLEEKWGVSAAPVAAPVAAQSAGIAEVKEEKTQFDVILTSAGESKINVIKEVRAITNLGLQEAKTLVETAPQPVKTGIKKDEADSIKVKLEAVGAKVELK